jgi:uncharacterized membrane protein YhiD involved in acid resistance
MFELFPDQPVYEYSQMVNILYSFVWAFLLSSIIAIVHRLTFTGDQYPKNFFQSLILGAIVTTMVMMAIGDSLARGLGVFGAMAIIRFRTRIDDPRDVLFLFAALSTGLAIGVYGFTISFAGTVMFSIVAFVLHFSPFRSFNFNSKLYFTLTDASHLKDVIATIERFSRDYKVINITDDKEKGMRYQYSISFSKDEDKFQLVNDLKLIEGVKQVKITPNEILNG